MPLGSELLNINDFPNPGRSTIEHFRAAIRHLLGRSPLGGILYLPPGRYVIENALVESPAGETDLLPEWRYNLWERYVGSSETDRRGDLFYWRGARNRNPFGASLRFPAELTLWLAPNAVLVPNTDAIVHIESDLVCEPIRVFDLSLGGLVVFGSRVPRLLPQWWGTGLGGDDSVAIQAAIDAGIHNRTNLWEEAIPPESPGATYSINAPSLSCIPIELRGEYRLRTPVEIRGTATQNRLLEILGARAVERLPASTTARDTVFVGPDASVTIPADFADPLAVATAVEIPAFARAVLVENGRSIRITGVSINTGILTVTRAGGTESVRVTVENPLRARREINPIIPNTVIAGAWNGRTAHGARLVADPAFAADHLGKTLVRLLGTFGITLRNVAFEVGDASGPTCLDITPPVPPVPFQGVAIRGCSFAGGDATLVLLGPPPAIIPSRRTPDGDPVAEPSNHDSDISCIAFDECEFRPRSGGIGLMVRTSQSVPFRLRDCDFTGVARAMISAWEGRFLLDRCAFDNSPPATLPNGVPGFEDPDGADIYLHFEPPVLETFANGIGPRYFSDIVAAFAATGCVSRSPRFLSTAHPFARVAQRLEWPVLLLNVRHVPSPDSDGGAAVLWGMVNRTSSVSSVGGRDTARLGRGSALVIVGGQYGGSFGIYPGAVQSVLLGARGPGTQLMQPGLAAPSGTGITWPTDVFGLAYDRRSSR